MQSINKFKHLLTKRNLQYLKMNYLLEIKT